jgi:VanZ family protein
VPSQKTIRIVLAAYLATIYATLGVMKTITIFLRERGMLRLTVVSLFACAAIVAVAVLFRDPLNRTKRVMWTLAIAACVYLAAIYPMSSPEEKVHFIEYGVVALLAQASAPAAWPLRRQRAAAALFVLVAGWIDEGIQALLPNRFYDLRDVLFNTFAGLMALGVAAAVMRARRVDATA